MAQFQKETGLLDPKISNHYEVVMLANGASGFLVSPDNPLPVSLGSESVIINGNVIVKQVEVTNDVGNPLAISANNSPNAPGNPIYVEVANDSGNSLPISATTAQNSNTNPIYVEVSNDSGNALPISANTSPNAHGNPLYVEVTNGEFDSVPVAYVDGQVDAFGRLRVSDSYTLGDYKHLYGIDPNFVDITANGGTVVHRPYESCARLATTSNTTSSAIHQTKMYHHYMPGKSQLIKSSFNMYANTINVTKRSGYFDSNNGIYFEQAGDGTLSLCLRTNFSTGNPDDSRKIPQSQWNIDKLDGTGPSKYNLDITKTQLFWIDFQWLGVGRVRCGFVNNGKYVIAHEFYNSNYLPNVYMVNPNLPVRCEILNTGATTGGYMDQICSTVMSEGGYALSGQEWSASSSSLRTISAGQTLPVLAIKLKNSFRNIAVNRMYVKLMTVNVFSTADNIRYRVLKLPHEGMITNGTWYDVNANSGVQFANTATATTDGEELESGFVAATAQNSQKSVGNSQSAQPAQTKKNYIVQNYTSTNSEIYVVSVTNIGSSNTDVGVGMSWVEIY